MLLSSSTLSSPQFIIPLFPALCPREFVIYQRGGYVSIAEHHLFHRTPANCAGETYKLPVKPRGEERVVVFDEIATLMRPVSIGIQLIDSTPRSRGSRIPADRSGRAFRRPRTPPGPESLSRGCVNVVSRFEVHLIQGFYRAR